MGGKGMLLSLIRKLMIYILVWCVILSFFYFTVWRPGMRDIDKLEKQISINRNVLDMIKQHLQEKPRLSEETIRKAEESLKLFLAKIPSERDVPEVLERIRKIGIERGDLVINSISDETGTTVKRKTGEYLKAIYKLRATGDLPQIMRFLADLESSERLISIEALSMRADETRPGRIDLDLTFAVFYSPATDGEVRDDEKA